MQALARQVLQSTEVHIRSKPIGRVLLFTKESYRRETGRDHTEDGLQLVDTVLPDGSTQPCVKARES